MQIKRNVLLNPGPATTTDTVKMAQIVPDICPREKEFVSMMKQMCEDFDSVFPSVASGRPDDKDKAAMKAFAAKCCQLLSIRNLKNYKEISLPGTQGYDGFSYEGVPFKPDGDDKCVACGECRRICPQNAISEGDFRKTNNELCIACGACIKVCPAGARNYHSEVYEQVRNDFEKMCSEYKVPEMFYVEGAE